MNLLFIIFWFTSCIFSVYELDKDESLFNYLWLVVSFIAVVFFAMQFDEQITKTK
jgi:hypothetical protein